jgi:hypothetical protein
LTLAVPDDLPSYLIILFFSFLFFSFLFRSPEIIVGTNPAPSMDAYSRICELDVNHLSALLECWWRSEGERACDDDLNSRINEPGALNLLRIDATYKSVKRLVAKDRSKSIPMHAALINVMNNDNYVLASTCVPAESALYYEKVLGDLFNRVRPENKSQAQPSYICHDFIEAYARSFRSCITKLFGDKAGDEVKFLIVSFFGPVFFFLFPAFHALERKK